MSSVIYKYFNLDEIDPNDVSKDNVELKKLISHLSHKFKFPCNAVAVKEINSDKSPFKRALKFFWVEG